MIYRKNDGEVGALDYREKAPKKSSRDMYLDDKGEIIEGLSMIGGLSIGVPGTIAGVFEVHDKFGSLPIEELIKPAIDLANKGG
jgi:gamma-glutamyltranspeptidase/glutathione hydrolase